METNVDFQYEYFPSVTQQNVEWLWYPYIPYGKLTIVQGDPGEGKSTFILNIAALLTRGKSMPDGFHVPVPQRVVYQTAEDNIADTVKPKSVVVPGPWQVQIKSEQELDGSMERIKQKVGQIENG